MQVISQMMSYRLREQFNFFKLPKGQRQNYRMIKRFLLRFHIQSIQSEKILGFVYIFLKTKTVINNCFSIFNYKNI